MTATGSIRRLLPQPTHSRRSTRGWRRGRAAGIAVLLVSTVLVSVGSQRAYAATEVDLTATVNDGGLPMVGSQDAQTPAGTWTITVYNVGTAATTSTTTVNVAPSSSITGGVLGLTGSGWTCTLTVWPNAQCTTDALAAAGATLPPITATLGVYAGYGAVAGTITVSNSDDAVPGNNSISLRSAAEDGPVDLTLDANDGGRPFASSPNAQSVAGSWTVTVHNIGTVASTGTITVNIGFYNNNITGAILSIGGTGWSCSPVFSRYNCDTDASVPGGGSLPPIVAQLGVYPAYGSVYGEFSVSNPSESLRWNDTVTLLTPIVAGLGPDVTVNIIGDSPLFDSGKPYQYQLVVRNVGDGATVGAITVSYPNAAGDAATASGTGWTCIAGLSGDYGGTCTTSTSASYHPNPSGHAAIATYIRGAFG